MLSEEQTPLGRGRPREMLNCVFGRGGLSPSCALCAGSGGAYVFPPFYVCFRNSFKNELQEEQPSEGTSETPERESRNGRTQAAKTES